jgi:hypothetical protein
MSGNFIGEVREGIYLPHGHGQQERWQHGMKKSFHGIVLYQISIVAVSFLFSSQSVCSDAWRERERDHDSQRGRRRRLCREGLLSATYAFLMLATFAMAVATGVVRLTQTAIIVYNSR